MDFGLIFWARGQVIVKSYLNIKKRQSKKVKTEDSGRWLTVSQKLIWVLGIVGIGAFKGHISDHHGQPLFLLLTSACQWPVWWALPSFQQLWLFLPRLLLDSPLWFLSSSCSCTPSFSSDAGAHNSWKELWSMAQLPAAIREMGQQVMATSETR